MLPDYPRGDNGGKQKKRRSAEKPWRLKSAALRAYANKSIAMNDEWVDDLENDRPHTELSSETRL